MESRTALGIATLVVRGGGKPPQAELLQMIADDRVPDSASAEEAINAFFIDDRYLETIPGIRGRIVRGLPYPLAQVVEVFLNGPKFDVVLTWSDLPSVLVAGLMRLWPGRPALVAILFWPATPKKAFALRLVQRSIDRMIVCAPLQRRFLQEQLGISSDRFIDAQLQVDVRFWRPLAHEQDLICSVGQEMRDYATLIEALRPLDIRCHIAVGSSVFGRTTDRWWRNSLRSEELPETVTVGSMNVSDLRELYARSRFVVVPLRPSDNDNGITTILEAFAMGKAVIATDTRGQVGVLEDGVNCLRVPPFDAPALRSAITKLWNDPELCARLGAAGRERVVARHGVDSWARSLVQAVEEATAVRRTHTGKKGLAKAS